MEPIFAILTYLVPACAESGSAPEKTLFYQLAMAVPVSAVCVLLSGERMSCVPSHRSIASLIFRTAWVSFITSSSGTA